MGRSVSGAKRADSLALDAIGLFRRNVPRVAVVEVPDQARRHRFVNPGPALAGESLQLGYSERRSRPSNPDVVFTSLDIVHSCLSFSYLESTRCLTEETRAIILAVFA